MRDKIQEAVSEYMKLQHKKQSEETALTRFASACNINPPHTSLPRQLALNLKAKVRLPTEESDPTFFKEEETQLQAVEQEANKKIYEIVFNARKRHIDYLAQRLELPRFIPQQVAAFSSSADEIAKIAQEHIQSSSSVLITFPKQKLIDHFQSTLTSEITKAVAARVVQQRQMEVNREQQRQADEKAKDDAMNAIHTGQALKQIARQEANQAMIPLVNEHAKLKHKQHLTQQLLSNYAAAAAAAASASTTSSSSEHRPNNKRKHNQQRNNDAIDNNDDLEDGKTMDEESSSPNPLPLHKDGRHQKRGKHAHPFKQHFHQGGQQLTNQSYQVAAPIYQFPIHKQVPHPARRQH